MILREFVFSGIAPALTPQTDPEARGLLQKASLFGSLCPP